MLCTWVMAPSNRKTPWSAPMVGPRILVRVVWICETSSRRVPRISALELAGVVAHLVEHRQRRVDRPQGGEQQLDVVDLQRRVLAVGDLALPGPGAERGVEAQAEELDVLWVGDEVAGGLGEGVGGEGADQRRRVAAWAQRRADDRVGEDGRVSRAQPVEDTGDDGGVDRRVRVRRRRQARSGRRRRRCRRRAPGWRRRRCRCGR